MSHYTVLVCLDDPNRLDEVLAPFDENMAVTPYRDYEGGEPKDYWAVDHLREENGLNPDDATLTWAQVAETYTARYGPEDTLLVDDDGRAYQMSRYNPDSKWDWYLIGGRWTGYFAIRPDASPDDLINGEPGVMTPPNRDPRKCDGGRKGALDLDAMRTAKAAEARETYAKWRKAVDGTPEARSWREFADRIGEDYAIDQARADYGAQPRVKAIRDTDLDPFLGCAIETYQKPERLFVEIARAQAVPGYAVLTLDGKWMAPGRMGWFGTSTDGESERAGYWEVANAYLESLSDTTWLVLVDCHI